MSEEERPTETVEQPTSKYLSQEFVENAPVDAGVDELMDYLDGYMAGEVQTAVAQEHKLDIPEDDKDFSQAARDVIQDKNQDRIDFEARIRSDVLRWHVFMLHEAHTKKDEGDSQGAARQEKWREGMNFITDHGLRLSNERAIIEHLFAQASALSGGAVASITLEGEVLTSQRKVGSSA